MARRPAKLKIKAPKATAAAATAAPPTTTSSHPRQLDDWVVTLREVMQDVQALALERTTHTSTTTLEPSQSLHQASFAPALRRLRRVFYADVGVGRALAEERWLLFRDELWLAIARVLAATRAPTAIVTAFGAFFGAFLSGDAGDHRAERTVESSASKQQRRSLNELRNELVTRLVDASQAEHKHVRMGACHFLQAILNKLETVECV